MRSTYVRYKGGCAIDAQKTWAQMQWRGKGRGLEVERRLGCGELGIAWTGSKAPGHAQIGECGKPCSGPTRRPPPRGWQIESKNTAGDGGWWAAVHVIGS
jgi:hypothetical protein